jgi:hypothetical protein
MGLLRRRPRFELDSKSEDKDSAFQALARLSLANDNDMLLERLICLLPREPEQDWYSVKDAYKSKLWDIYPSCQIAGVCEDDSVIIDGAFGATIHWDKFRKVANARRQQSWKRFACQFALHGAPYALIWGTILFASSLNAKTLLGDLRNGFNETNTTITDLEGVLPNNFIRENTYASPTPISIPRIPPIETSTADVGSWEATITQPVSLSETTATAEGVDRRLARRQIIGSEVSKASTLVVGEISKVETLASSAVNKVSSEVAHITSAVMSRVSEAAALESKLELKMTHVDHSVGVATKWAVFIEVIGIFLLLMAGFIFILSPYLTRKLYRGKFCE